MVKVVELGQELSTEDRNLLSVTYKNNINNMRMALGCFKTLETKEESRKPKDLITLRVHKMRLMVEMLKSCLDIVKLVGNKLISESRNI
jgi:hypothetical protein